MLGEEYLKDQANILSFRIGKGYVVTYGSQIDFRTQPRATFKLIFNAIFHGPSTAVPAAQMGAQRELARTSISSEQSMIRHSSWGVAFLVTAIFASECLRLVAAGRSIGMAAEIQSLQRPVSTGPARETRRAHSGGATTDAAEPEGGVRHDESFSADPSIDPKFAKRSAGSGDEVHDACDRPEDLQA